MGSTNVVDLTEEEMKTIYQNIQNRQSFENQRKMGGSPSRRRRFDTGDAGPYCVVLWNDERTTGKVVRACVRACVGACVCFILYVILCCVL